ncbi:nucleotide sugar dehydrogenase [Pirellulales bacterium]|nr:nucleotide sugar dehydrogenase [Pirellulales bacterium]MDA7937998.1 nucleotide sugar dehydrogenase [Pirellulales bacterium]
MNVHARIKAPVAETSLVAERGRRDCGLRLVDERDNTVEQSFYDVAVIGLGYVGLPLCLAFSKAKSRVLGLDIDEAKVSKIQAGVSYIKHIANEDVQKAREQELLTASADFSQAFQSDAILICVPTPLTVNRTPDLSYVESTARALAPHICSGQLIVLESTTYPGTTDEVLKPILEEGSGLVAGKDFFLAYSPEREDPGNPKSNFSDCPKVVGGFSETCLTKATNLYQTIVKTVVPVSNCRVAEATKLMENIFRSVNIALVNELKVIYAHMGIDVWEVIQAAATKPYGYMPFFPGPGLGGHCIPIDPFYLTWKALEYGHHTRLIELAGEINTSMPDYVISRIIDALNDASKPVRGSRVLVLGVAYKANVDDDRESPSYNIIESLEKRGASVSYNDPHVPIIRKGRSNSAVSGKASVPITTDYDVLVLCTNHESYGSVDFKKMDVPLVDCRNACQQRPDNYYAA